MLRVDKPDAGSKPTEVFKDGVQYVWSVRATTDGSVYVATGPTGQLHEIKPDGTSRVLLDTTENNVLSLVADNGDFLYAGTDPNGLIYRINRKTGEAFVLYDAVESEVAALAARRARQPVRGDGRGARGPGGRSSRAGGGGAGGPAGGGASGVPLPSQPPTNPEPPKLPDATPGQPAPIPKAAPSAGMPFDLPSNPFAAAAAAEGGEDGGDVESPGGPPDAAPGEPPAGRPDAGPAAAAEPRPGPHARPQPAAVRPAARRPATVGENNVPGRQPPVDARAAGQPRPEGNAVYRIDTEGFVSEIFRQPVLVFAMAERQGSLLLATGSEGNIYQVSPAAEETIVLAKVNPKQVLSILPAKDGRIYLGLANAGGIAAMSLGYATTGTFTSPVLDATQVSRFGKMQLRGLLPGQTSLKVATRQQQRARRDGRGQLVAVDEGRAGDRVRAGRRARRPGSSSTA